MKSNAMTYPGRLLKRELTARALSANRLALDIGVPSGWITDILNGRRSITADTAVRLGRYFGNSAQFYLLIYKANTAYARFEECDASKAKRSSGVSMRPSEQPNV